MWADQSNHSPLHTAIRISGAVVCKSYGSLCSKAPLYWQFVYVQATYEYSCSVFSSVANPLPVLYSTGVEISIKSIFTLILNI